MKLVSLHAFWALVSSGALVVAMKTLQVVVVVIHSVESLLVSAAVVAMRALVVTVKTSKVVVVVVILSVESLLVAAAFPIPLGLSISPLDLCPNTIP